MKPIISIITLALAASIFACGPKRDDSKKEAEEQNEKKFEDSKIEDDAEFAVAAADGSLLEVQLGQLAQTNAVTPEVKAFGQAMIDDHSKANEELKALAASKGITLPSGMSNKCQNIYDDLAKKTGKDFDDAYTDLMVKDHKDDIDEFKDESENGKDSDLKSWAAGKLPILEHHLEMAKQTETIVDKIK